MYVHVTNNTPTKINLRTYLKNNFPNVSFPSSPSETLLTRYNIYPLETVRPDFNSATQVREYQGISLVDGAWTEVWTVRNKTQGELVAEQDAAKDRAESQISSDLSALKALAAGIHDHENRLRALENKSPVTFQQVLMWLKSKL